jgi:hypothetical protein
MRSSCTLRDALRTDLGVEQICRIVVLGKKIDEILIGPRVRSAPTSVREEETADTSLSAGNSMFPHHESKLW